MNTVNKSKIVDLLVEDYQKINSLRELSSLTSVSEAYLSQMINKKADPGHMTWNKLYLFYATELRGVEILDDLKNYNTINNAIHYAKSYITLHCLIGVAGCGKTTASRKICKNVNNAYYLQCSKYSQREFLEELARVLHVSSSGSLFSYTKAIREKLLEVPSAVLVLDEASMLSDSCLLRIKEIYGDQQSSRAGIVMLGVPSLQEKLIKNAQRNRLGFAELLDRIQPFEKLDPAKPEEVEKICAANNVRNKKLIDIALKKAENSGSFRGVETATNKQLIENLKRGDG